MSIDQRRAADEPETDTAAGPNSSFQLGSLIPSPLRHCLAGKESKRQGAAVDAATAASSSTCTDKSLPQNLALSKKSASSYSRQNSSEDNESPNNSTVAGECYTSVSSMTSENLESEYDFETSDKGYSFLSFRLSYLFVTLVVMLADGLQGVFVTSWSFA